MELCRLVVDSRVGRHIEHINMGLIQTHEVIVVGPGSKKQRAGIIFSVAQ